MVKRWLLGMVLLSMVVFLVGCAEANLVTFVDPDYRGVRFSSVMVVVPVANFDLRSQVEGKITACLAEEGVRAVKSVDLFSPTRAYTEPEMARILAANEIDTYLIVAQTDYWVSETYVPKSAVTQGTVNDYGNYLGFSSTTRTYGGYTITKPNARYDVRLFDARSHRTVWLGNSIVNGNGFSDFTNLVEALGRKLASQLVQDGVLGALPPAQPPAPDQSSW